MKCYTNWASPTILLEETILKTLFCRSSFRYGATMGSKNLHILRWITTTRTHTHKHKTVFFLAHTRRPTQYIGFLQTFMFFSTKNHTAHDFQIVFFEIYLLQFNWMAHPIFDWSQNCSDGKPSEKLLLLVARKNRWRLFFQCDSALNHAKF